MKNILSYTPEELKELMVSIGEPAYRAKQIFTQLHKGIMLDEMTNVGKVTKEKLHAAVDCSFPGIKRKLVSQLDGTVKYLFSLSDGNCIESVVMKYEHGYTICVSSQVGCRMGCKFCASTVAGRVRDLEAGEILGQIISAQRDMGVRISNIVMMGIGEPLDNYDNVVKFLNIVNLPDGVNIGYRHISLST
jgi:23S rRNA (adenine2503-C2)-methyltransferase